MSDGAKLDEFAHAAREQLSAPSLTQREQQFGEYLQRNIRAAGYEPMVVAVTGDKYQHASFLVMAVTRRESEPNRKAQREALLEMAEQHCATAGLLPEGHMRSDLIIRPPTNLGGAE